MKDRQFVVAQTSCGNNIFDINVVSEYVRMEYHVSDTVERLRRESPGSNSIANYYIMNKKSYEENKEFLPAHP